MSSPAPFNALFKELLTVVKNGTASKRVRNAIKADHRVWNAASPKLAEAFHARFEAAYPAVLESGFQGVPGDQELLARTSVADVLASVKESNVTRRIEALVLALFAVSQAAHLSDEPAACADVVNRTQRELGGVESELPDVVLDDELVAFIRAAAAGLAATGGACGLPLSSLPGPTSPAGFSPNPDSALMTIVRDISSGIDPAVLGRPDAMQQLVQSVSSSIGERIRTGDLDASALMAETSAIMQHVDMSQALQMMGGLNLADLPDLSGIAANMQQGAAPKVRTKDS